jgi:hypothetical protein
LKRVVAIAAVAAFAACGKSAAPEATSIAPNASPHVTATPTKGPGTTPVPITPRPDATESSSSGVEGKVQAGPTCPVEREGDPCPDRPVADATVSASDTQGKLVAATRSDDNGKYRLDLDPGTYDVTATSRSVMACDTQRVHVVERKYTQATITCDTGIR